MVINKDDAVKLSNLSQLKQSEINLDYIYRIIEKEAKLGKTNITIDNSLLLDAVEKELVDKVI